MKKFLLFLSCCVLLSLHSFAQSEFEFTHFNNASKPVFRGDNFKAVAVAREGHVWAGSQYHGVVKYNPKDGTWDGAYDLQNELITDIKTDKYGNVWIANAGRSGTQGGGSNIGGGISQFHGLLVEPNMFYTITSPGFLTSRNARSIWIDPYRNEGSQSKVWVAQGTYISSNQTLAGGFSVGKNDNSPFFTKGYVGLQVTPYVGQSSARTPSCLAIGGNRDEVWIFAQANFGKNQLLRYKAGNDANTFLGFYDYTNTPVLSNGFRANAIYFDDLSRGWIGLQDGGIIIKTGDVWKTMNAPTVFPVGTIINPNAITSDPQGYVYIGTNNGLVIYHGGPVDVAGSYRRVTTTDGLPTNMINGIAADTFANRIILAHNAGISFMKYKKKVNATLEWDYSFPKLTIKPKGVATDGVSRLYIKVRRNDSVTLPIKKISLAVKNVGATISSMVGKLKVATVLDKYSNEANEGTSTEVSRTDSTPSGDFYFWYVAPEDFSKDSLSPEASMSEREDSIKVKVTYNDDTADSSYISVKLQRPPLMIGSMINKAAAAIGGLVQPDDIPFVKSDKFGLTIKLVMNQVSSMAENVSRLIDGDILQNEDKENSFQGAADLMRKMGFASTRVDFVGQGLAGNVARWAESLKPDKFYANGNYAYNNYAKGFINKLITINTPHNNTPVFDAIKTLFPAVNDLMKNVLQQSAKANPDTINPYSVVSFDGSNFAGLPNLLAKASMDSGGFRLPRTNLRNHLIISNVVANADNPEAIKSYGLFGKLNEVLMMAMRDQTTSPQLKATLTEAFGQINTTSTKILKFINEYAETKGISNFSSNSDLIVPLSSQAAGQPETLPNITKFTSSIVEQVTHHGMLVNKAVGAKIYQLLNTSIHSNTFSSFVPANTTLAQPISALANKIAKVLYDTAKIVTDGRQLIGNTKYRTSNSLADTTISLKYRVKDTVGLQYIFVNFQDSLYTTTSKQRNQEVMLKVKHTMALSGMQNIVAVGVYESKDSINYHADTIRTYVTAPDSIQGFRVTQRDVDLFDGILHYPAYQVKVKDEWQTLPANDSSIKITIEKPDVLLYNSSRLAFDANKDGFSRAYFTYKEFKDTAAFDCLLSLAKSAINRTIVSGNFKDSATWSKGRPPLRGDSVIISAGHTIVLDTTVQIRSLRIDSLATLTLNQSTKQLQLGGAEDGDFVLDNYGTLNISNGGLTVKGRVKLNKGATFNMSGGSLVIDGNTGQTITSLANGLYLFEVAPQMTSFLFTGGTLQIVDPPIGVASQSISCPYEFGINSTLVLGNGISLTASSSPAGFGGSQFPPVLGKLVLDAGTGKNNRQLIITKPLNVKGSLEIKTGSQVVLQAELKVTK